MRGIRAFAAAASVTALSIAAWASPATAHNPAVVTAKRVVIRPHTNQMTCSLQLPAVCEQGPGNKAVVQVVVPDEFRPVQQVCVTFHFEGDLLDPGEVLAFLGGGGFVNVGSTPQTVRTLCLTREGQPDETRLFRDGRQTMNVWMEQGSAFLSKVEVVVTGHRR